MTVQGTSQTRICLQNRKANVHRCAIIVGRDLAEVAEDLLVEVGADKAKAVVVVGALKVKSGTSAGIKWIKNQYLKRTSSK
ncbi:hypothetical protein SESBI_43082 [Sesbania bispinosa]|nr:hypothetical protein SESBI_43082 [Sesbania bispinosa]